MTKYRDHKELYTRDFSKYSVYPSIRKPEEYRAKRLDVGQLLEVSIFDIDESGRGLARFGDYVIKINGGGTVGDRVKIKITQVRDNVAMAEIVEFL